MEEQPIRLSSAIRDITVEVDSKVPDRVDAPFIVAARPKSATGDGFFCEFEEVGVEVNDKVGAKSARSASATDTFEKEEFVEVGESQRDEVEVNVEAMEEAPRSSTETEEALSWSEIVDRELGTCLLYTSPSPRD